MFRHVGKGRTLVHNLQLASLLSLVAGIVNVTGIFALQTLTTNVTGHFAYFADEVAQNHFGQALVFLLYILSFLFGAFSSNFFIEITSRHDFKYGVALPVFIEVFILIFIRSEEHTSELQSQSNLVCRLLLEKKKKKKNSRNDK